MLDPRTAGPSFTSDIFKLVPKANTKNKLNKFIIPRKPQVIYDVNNYTESTEKQGIYGSIGF